MLISAGQGLPPINVFDADGFEIRHCIEIDTETGTGVACSLFLGEPPCAVPIAIDFVGGNITQVQCHWKAPIEIRSRSGAKICSPAELLALRNFHSLEMRIAEKARVTAKKQKDGFSRLQRRLDWMRSSLQIAMHEFGSFTVLPPDDYEIL